MPERETGSNLEGCSLLEKNSKPAKSLCKAMEGREGWNQPGRKEGEANKNKAKAKTAL